MQPIPILNRRQVVRRLSARKELISNALREFVTTRKRLNLLDLDGKIEFSEAYDHKRLSAGPFADVCRRLNQIIQLDPDAPDACDLLVMESTYGDRNHEGGKERVDALKRLLH